MLSGGKSEGMLDVDENDNLLVPPNYAALVIDEDGRVELSLPSKYCDGETTMPGSVILLASVAKLIEDEEWFDATVKRAFPDAAQVEDDTPTEGTA